MGDFNAKVCAEEILNVAGKFDLGERNDRGKRLIQFSQEHNMAIMDTWFKLPKQRLFTWKSLQDGQQNRIVRNQIDYIVISHRLSIKPALRAYQAAGDYKCIYILVNVSVSS